MPANEGERAEQLEVASQCLCDAFEIDLDAAAMEFGLLLATRAAAGAATTRLCGSAGVVVEAGARAEATARAG